MIFFMNISLASNMVIMGKLPSIDFHSLLENWVRLTPTGTISIVLQPLPDYVPSLPNVSPKFFDEIVDPKKLSATFYPLTFSSDRPTHIDFKSLVESNSLTVFSGSMILSTFPSGDEYKCVGFWDCKSGRAMDGAFRIFGYRGSDFSFHDLCTLNSDLGDKTGKASDIVFKRMHGFWTNVLQDNGIQLILCCGYEPARMLNGIEFGRDSIKVFQKYGEIDIIPRWFTNKDTRFILVVYTGHPGFVTSHSGFGGNVTAENVFWELMTYSVARFLSLYEEIQRLKRSTGSTILSFEQLQSCKTRVETKLGENVKRRMEANRDLIQRCARGNL